ncbi:MAG: hypothetical protein M1820_007088 [Bogoriella megaspora]|nr:MAG: hypothetical protein M1820_007088 [Bogoriella megaspora]
MAPPPNLYDEGLQKFREDVKDRIRDDKDRVLLNEFLSDRSTPKEAQDACKTLGDQSGEKYGGVKSGDKEIIPAKWISNILGNIDSFVAVGNFAMKGAPESVGMAWFAVKLTLSAIQSNYQLYSLFGSGLTDITEMMVIIRHYDRLYDERQKPGWKASDIVDRLFRDIRATYAAVLDFSFSVKRHLAGGKLSKLRHGLKDFFGAELPKFQGKIDAISDLKKKVLEATDGAFQAKTFEKFDEVQDVVKSVQANVQDIKDFQKTSEEFYHAQLAQQNEILQKLDDVKASTKPKTRWDWAKVEYEKNKKLLNPLHDTTAPLDSYSWHEGTCQWLLQDDYYTDWLDSSVSNMMCIGGPSGAGKSTLLAAVVEKLDSELDQDSTVLQYLSCDMSSSGEMGDNSPQSLVRLGNTLIYQLYELASADENDATLLENCNKVFTNPKRRKVSKVVSETKGEDALPDLADALEKLALNLEKNVVFVIDAVDHMSDEDQNELFNGLQDLIGRGEEGDSHFRILLACRSNTKFFDRIIKEVTTIDLGNGWNKDDIDLVLSTELDRMPGWSADEREEAKVKILEKAGPIFQYVVKVAIPFIQQPFQRPLSNRLKELPEGMSETYNQAIRGMASNYLDLLRTALSWTLLAPGSIKVLEVMEAYNGVYLLPADDVLPKIEAEKDGSYDKFASDLEISQLRSASGPFLNILEEDGGQSFVVLKDPFQVRHFCLHSTQNVEAQEIPGDTICAKCKASLNPSKSLSITEREGHLNIAITLVRHLNSPLFQSRYGLVAEKKEEEENEGKDTTPEDEGYSSPQAEGENQSEPEVDAVKDEARNIHDGDSDADEDAMDNDGKAGNGDGSVDGSSKSDKDKNDSGYETDDSMDDEDRGEISLKPKTNDEEEAAQTSQEDWKDNMHRYIRYEINYWYDHVREAEDLWTPEERAISPLWSTLMTELDRFVDENTAAFNEWQTFMFYRQDMQDQEQPWKPLHVAAYLGLTSWAEHLIKRGESLTEKCYNSNPLQAAAFKANSPPMLKLLLECGIDPNVEESNTIPAFHGWLWDDASYDSMELMLKHGADLKMTDQRNGWTALHYFASEGEDPKVLELLLNKDDPNNQPDINAKDRDGETPLHVLLSRREVPGDLLDAFIASGADVNAEDKDSQRPLHEASVWGDADIIRRFIPKVTEIDDDDKHGRTALHEAAWAGYKECVELLLENNADPNKTDLHNRTPLFFACLGESVDTIKLLLETLGHHKVPISEINKATKRDRTPLRQAAAHGFTEVVEDLLHMIKSSDIDHDTMINKADTKKGRTALHCAAYRGQTDSVRVLLEQGASVSIKDHEGKTPLVIGYEQWALSEESSFEEIIMLIIDKDPSAATQDTELLAAAAVNGSNRVLEKLYSLGANLNRPDQYGWTPIMLAKQFHRTEAEAFLKQQANWAGTLPSRWINAPSSTTLSENGLTLTTDSQARLCISANRPLPAGLERFYFEVSSKKMESVEQLEYPEMAIGFCTIGATAFDFPGWPPTQRAPSARSWAYHGDDGGFGDGAGSFAEFEDAKYKPGDTVGAGVDFAKRKMWFTRNGEKMDTVFEDVKGRLFPLVGVCDVLELETNFGTKPFVWRDDGGSEGSEGDGESVGYDSDGVSERGEGGEDGEDNEGGEENGDEDGEGGADKA